MSTENRTNRRARALLLVTGLSLAGVASSSPGDDGGKGKLPDALTEADFALHSAEEVELGRLLFFDKELSGNRNISCATCHHSLTDTGDGLSLPLGEGASGLGVTRATNGNVRERVPRNAPPLFNLGALEVTVMFHDGRVEVDASAPSGFRSPAGDDLPPGLDSALAAQAMFPVTSGTEMAGQPGENPIANAADAGDLAGPEGVWARLAERLQDIPAYVLLFQEAYPDEIQVGSDITFVHAANAIAAFESTAWRSMGSPFDRALRGDRKAMSTAEWKGMKLFYGKAGCASCHSGSLLSDQRFHAVGMPQVGPGKGDGTFGYEDFGRERVTGDAAERHRFRTPMLRNVALTGPWGHAGAFDSLEAVVRHQLDPVRSMAHYDRRQCVLPPDPALDPYDFECLNDPAATLSILLANELTPRWLSDAEVASLVDFLHALTDPHDVDLRSDVPWEVPSGLSVAD
jgi:cytochrome c peroxidase